MQDSQPWTFPANFLSTLCSTSSKEPPNIYARFAGMIEVGFALRDRYQKQKIWNARARRNRITKALAQDGRRILGIGAELETEVCECNSDVVQLIEILDRSEIVRTPRLRQHLLIRFLFFLEPCSGHSGLACTAFLGGVMINRNAMQLQCQ